MADDADEGAAGEDAAADEDAADEEHAATAATAVATKPSGKRRKCPVMISPPVR
jgi:hypothetical protein